MLALALFEAGPRGRLSPTYDAWLASVRSALDAVALDRGVDAVGEALLRAVFGAWDQLTEVWRDTFTANGPAISRNSASA